MLWLSILNPVEGHRGASRARETGKNISSVSIVTPRERNDSAFRQEKCRPGIFLRSLSPAFSLFLSLAAILVFLESGVQVGGAASRTKGEKEGADSCVRAHAEKRTNRDGKALKLLHTWRQSRRIHACVRIYSGWYIVGGLLKKEHQDDNEEEARGPSESASACRSCRRLTIRDAHCCDANGAFVIKETENTQIFRIKYRSLVFLD